LIEQLREFVEKHVVDNTVINFKRPRQSNTKYTIKAQTVTITEKAISITLPGISSHGGVVTLFPIHIEERFTPFTGNDVRVPYDWYKGDKAPIGIATVQEAVNTLSVYTVSAKGEGIQFSKIGEINSVTTDLEFEARKDREDTKAFIAIRNKEVMINV
jgi:hypothetical protein